MSYITLALSPYRGNLNEEIGEILKEDHEAVCKQLQSRGLIFLAAYIIVMGISVLKVIYHIFDHYRKPERPIPKITRGNVDRATGLSYLYSIKEVGNYNTRNYKTKNHENRVDAIQLLRQYLYSNNLQLTGKIIKEVNHKVSDHAFISSIISGEYEAKFATTYITFGEKVDNMLVEVLPTKPKKRTIQGVKCLAFENDYGFMVQELRNLYQEPIKVTFDSK